VKTLLEQEDIQAIALAVMEMVKPMLGNGRQTAEDTLLTIEELMTYMKVSKRWIYERTHLKEIPYLKIDGQVRFRKKEIDRWIDTFKIPAAGTSVSVSNKYK
jgi:excisionase family DNA binding protein